MVRSKDYLNANPAIMQDIVNKIQAGMPVPFPCAPGDDECPTSFVMRSVPTATLTGKKLNWVIFLVGPGVSGPFRADLFFIFEVKEGDPNRADVVGYLAPDTKIPLIIDSIHIWAVL
ncbi:hypothetical protein OB992_07050 [Bacillus cereus]|nr:hypothetical protein [Bacillus cereus]